MNRRRFLLVSSLVILLFLSVGARESRHALAAGQNHYVWCGATGSASGADWTNAYTDLPAALVRGDTYYVAGSASCLYATHTFNDADSGTTRISVLGATAANAGGVAGWQSSMDVSVNPATWSPASPDTNPQDHKGALWKICRSYYTFDGTVGSTNPVTGPGGQGFKIGSIESYTSGIINEGDNNGCTGGSELIFKNNTYNHLELFSQRLLAVSTNSCSFDGVQTVSVTFPSPLPWNMTTSNTVDPFDSTSGGTILQDTANHTVIGAAVTAITGPANAVTGLSFTIPATYNVNPCTQTKGVSNSSGPVAALSISDAGSVGLYFVDVVVDDQHSGLTIQNSYIHDMPNMLATAGLSSSTITNNYWARNRSTPTQHANAMVEHVGASASQLPAWAASHAYVVVNGILDSNGNVEWVKTAGTSGGSTPTWATGLGQTTTDGGVTWINTGTNAQTSSNNTISFNAYQDIQGTAVLAWFDEDEPTNANPSVGTDANYSVYGNLFWLTTPSTSDGPSQVIACFGKPASFSVACSHFRIYNNTFYNFDGEGNSISRISLSESDASSIDNEVYDNLFVNGFNVAPIATGAICYDQSAGCASTAAIIQDYNYYSQMTGSTASDAHGQFTSVTPFVNASGNNFHLTTSTTAGLSFGSPLNLDFDGLTRGADGTWDRGAYEFNSSTTNTFNVIITGGVTTIGSVVFL